MGVVTHAHPNDDGQHHLRGGLGMNDLTELGKALLSLNEEKVKALVDRKIWVNPDFSKGLLGEIATYLSFSPCEQGQ